LQKPFKNLLIILPKIDFKSKAEQCDAFTLKIAISGMGLICFHHLSEAAIFDVALFDRKF